MAEIAQSVPLYSTAFEHEWLLNRCNVDWDSTNKLLLAEIRGTYELQHQGYATKTGPLPPVEFSRWGEIAPAEDAFATKPYPVITIVDGPFTYKDDPSRASWHANFADAELFRYCTGYMFAQDEHQVAEHPALAHMRTALRTIDHGVHLRSAVRALTSEIATPCLIANVPRRLHVDTTMPGIYGNGFARATREMVCKAVRVMDPVPLSNIFAMKAPSPCDTDSRYLPETLGSILRTAHTTFSAVVSASSALFGAKPTVVHTGAWGCGAFGGSVAVMARLQFLAALTAGVDEIVFHAFTPGQRRVAELARDFIVGLPGKLVAAPKVSSVLEMVNSEAYTWGSGDGN
jgi:hypothetical protein